MSQVITVIATVSAKKGKEAELEKILMGLLAPTRAEKGCLNYDLHRSAQNAGDFVFYENWASQEALDAHLQMQHIHQAMKSATDLWTEPVKITFWKKI